MTRSKIIISAKGLCKSFRQGDNCIQVLNKAQFTLKAGEIVALVGPSGCGKTTFLHLIGLLDLPDSGEIIIDKINYVKASDRMRTMCRRNKLGFVYQSHNLLTDFTALGNTLIPLQLCGNAKQKSVGRAIYLLEKLQLKERLNHYPSQLSGGEQQRVAIARSLSHNPDVILADEPTGNLDSVNAKAVLNLLIDTVRNLGKSLVIVTHNQEIAKKADRVLTIKNGLLINAK